MIETLVALLVVVVILGLIYWLATLLPIPEPFKTIALVIVVLGCIIYLAQRFL